MRVSVKWLKTMVELPADLRELTERLDLTGTAVEGVEVTGAALDGIVVGHILTRERHPDADRLWVTTVDVGEHNRGEDGAPVPLQIVCGAQNFEAGDKVPVALVGATLPSGDRIKKAKMRGVESRGMNCSARELGLGEDHAGLLVLHPDAPVGMPIAEHLDLSDAVIDLEITPNRPDCMSMLGIAREVGALYGVPYGLGREVPAAAAMPTSGAVGVVGAVETTPALRAAQGPVGPFSLETRCVSRALEPPPKEGNFDAATAAAGEAAESVCAAPVGGGVPDAPSPDAGEPTGEGAPAPCDASADALVTVSIDDPGRSARYTARVIRGVRIGPSPDWLAERVRAAGARSINNIVDVTNYLMFEMGQPLHAFDLDTLAKDADGRAHIVVRAAAEGERFTTLDGIERTLDADVTCIVDGNAADGAGRAVALAGVMGGLESEVTEATTDILLESATFSSAHTSRTSRRLQLFSEASARYERGVDAELCDEASARAAALMAEVSGGRVCEGVVDAYPAPTAPPLLSFRVGRFQDLVGAPVPIADIVGILTRLGCRMACHDRADGSYPATSLCHIMHGEDCAAALAAADLRDVAIPVQPPSYRPDLTREIDLYEEVLRVWGMGRVEPTLPGGRGRIGARTVEQQRLGVIGRALRASGLNETMTYVFASPRDGEVLAMPFEEHQQAVELVNPLNSEQGLVRRTVLPGLLRSVAYNQSHGVENVHLYETGTVFFASEGRKLPRERQMLAAVLAGSWTEGGWNEGPEPLGFFDGKGVLENLLCELNVAKPRFRPLEAAAAPWLQPGRAAEVLAGSRLLGWLGEVHPRVAAAFEAAAPVTAFELDVKALLASAEQARPYRDVPQFPAVALDLALVVEEDVSAERVGQAIRSAGGALLYELRLFDVYRDAEKIGAGRKSLAFSLTYRAPDRTLTLEEVEPLHQKVVKKATAATGGKLR